VKYRRQQHIAVDVDDTLYSKGKLNQALVTWMIERKAEGFTLMLWSSRGKAHAIKAAKMSDTTELFDTINSKPGYIVDDKGWEWIKYTREIHPDAI